MSSSRTLWVVLAGSALGLAVGCSRADNPRIADAPPYEPPPFTAPPPTMGTGDQAYEYGSNPDYQEAMRRMEASTGGGR